MNDYGICPRCGGDLSRGGSGHKILCPLRESWAFRFMRAANLVEGYVGPLRDRFWLTPYGP